MHHRVDAPVLTLLPIHAHRDVRIRGREFGLNPWAQRAEGVESFGPSPLSIGLLHISRGHVVGTRVSKNNLVHPIDGNVLAHSADDDGQLPFVLDLFGLPRQVDRVSRSDHRSTRLEKQQRLVGGFAVHFGGVFTVVLPDANDLGWDHRCQESDVRQFHDASLGTNIHERVALDGCDDRFVRHLIVIVETVDSSEPNVLADGETADQHRPTLMTNGPHACERIKPYVNASSSARQEAAMTFSCTPSVVHSRFPSEVDTRTRVTLAVPEVSASLFSRMRTL